MADFDPCLTFTLQQEGGWSDDPHDPGSATMDGITLAVYQQWKQDPSLTAADLAAISSSDVAQIYDEKYWIPVSGERLPSGIDLMIWDMAVNAGVADSVKLVQSAVGTTVDGILGPITLKNIQKLVPIILINSLALSQSHYYHSLAGFVDFGTGWLNRLAARQVTATALANNLTPTTLSTARIHPISPNDRPPQSFWDSLVVGE